MTIVVAEGPLGGPGEDAGYCPCPSRDGSGSRGGSGGSGRGSNGKQFNINVITEIEVFNL